MKKSFSIIFALFCICVYASTVRAAYVRETGQTLCYDASGSFISCAGTGQDGDLTAGTPWPYIRFTVNADQTVSDEMTGLIWMQDGNQPGPSACAPGVAKTWQEAQDYITCLNQNSYLSHNDWRLPSINELRTLINYNESNQATWLSTSCSFTNMKNINYWSSTTSAVSPDSALTVNMGAAGVINALAKATPGNMIAIRGGLDAVLVQPSSFSFGNIPNGSSSTAREFRIVNTSAASVMINSISITYNDASHFTVASGGSLPCASLAPTLLAGDSCTVLVTFSPTSTGPLVAMLSITDDLPANSTTIAMISGISDAAGIIRSRKTGQTVCYDAGGSVISCAGTGQNGELTTGTVWPSTRFTVNADQTVSDEMTGLIWMKDGNIPGPSACVPNVTKTWQAALDYITCLNQNSYLSHNDWRMPYINEMRTLINYGQSDQATWLATFGFTNMKHSDYWSSTNSMASTGSAFTVNLGTGGVTNTLAKGSLGYVLAVRAGFKAVLLQPAFSNFGNVVSGGSSTAREFRVVNSSASSVMINSISLTYNDASHFTVASGGSAACGSLTPTIPAGGSCTVLVFFSPTSIGPKIAKLSVIDNLDVNSTTISTITGIADAVGIIRSHETGQTLCYDASGAVIACAGTGQDGEQTAGKTWPSTRFTVTANQTVNDLMAGLIWMKDGYMPGPSACLPNVTKTWQGALDYVACLNQTSYLSYSDWRLPGFRELRTLINYGQSSQVTWLAASGFVNMKNSDYWSSTTSAASADSAFTVNMGTGGVPNAPAKTATGYVLAVRYGFNAAPVISAPSLTITRNSTVTYTITYYGADTITLSTGDITLNKTGTADGTIALSGTGNSKRTITISNITGDGALGFSIAANTASDLAGNTTTATGPSALFTVDNTPPTIVISAPSTTITKNSNVTYTVTYTGADAVTLANGNITLNKIGTANGTIATSGTGTSSRTVTVSGITGDGTLGISLAAGTASDMAGNSAAASETSAAFNVDATNPVLIVNTLANGSYTNNPSLNVTGTVTDNVGVASLLINNVSTTVNPDNSYSHLVTLQPGLNTITITASDFASNATTMTRTITLDQTAPALTVSEPADNSKTNQQLIIVQGMTEANTMVTVKVNGGVLAYALMSGTTFSHTTTFTTGQNTIAVTATDLAGNTTSFIRTVTYDSVAPSIAITVPNQDGTNTSGRIDLQGTVADALTAVSVIISDGTNLYTPTVINGIFQQTITFPTDGNYVITTTATDEAGNHSLAQRNINYVKWGDLDSSGVVDVSDALRALRIAAGLIQPAAIDLGRGDVAPLVNGKPQPDGTIDIGDVVVILRKSVGLISW